MFLGLLYPDPLVRGMDPDPDPDPSIKKQKVTSFDFLSLKKVITRKDTDPLVRGMDPRNRIHTNMSWIRNTSIVYKCISQPGTGN